MEMLFVSNQDIIQFAQRKDISCVIYGVWLEKKDINKDIENLEKLSKVLLQNR